MFNSFIDLNLRIFFELTLLLLQLYEIPDYVVGCVGKLRLLLLIFSLLVLGGDQKKKAKLFVALHMHPVENPRRQAKDPVKAYNRLFKALKTSVEHTTVVIVGQNFNSFNSSLEFCCRLVN